MVIFHSYVSLPEGTSQKISPEKAMDVTWCPGWNLAASPSQEETDGVVAAERISRILKVRPRVSGRSYGDIMGYTTNDYGDYGDYLYLWDIYIT